MVSVDSTATIARTQTIPGVTPYKNNVAAAIVGAVVTFERSRPRHRRFTGRIASHRNPHRISQTLPRSPILCPIGTSTTVCASDLRSHPRLSCTPNAPLPHRDSGLAVTPAAAHPPLHRGH
ncbi:hypothetical protein VTJ04DRAFT_5885 [Mycothermus thermophilus]|uniref:uncharacterized protein n=1 Tax=Humicola insolens TaxID=85995 RepID=UPI0037430FF5